MNKKSACMREYIYLLILILLHCHYVVGCFRHRSKVVHQRKLVDFMQKEHYSTLCQYLHRHLPNRYGCSNFSILNILNILNVSSSSTLKVKWNLLVQ